MMAPFFYAAALVRLIHRIPLIFHLLYSIEYHSTFLFDRNLTIILDMFTYPLLLLFTFSIRHL
jgi:hypothetical protein